MFKLLKIKYAQSTTKLCSKHEISVKSVRFQQKPRIVADIQL